MLLIEHYLAMSPIHGIGVFSTSFVSSGSRVWEMNPVIDRFITLEGLASLPTHICSHVMKHAEFLPKADAVRIAADGAYFMNHSDDPNLLDSGDEMFAIRDILPGEELLCDYRQTLVLAFDPDTGSRRLEFDPTNNCKNR